MLQSLSVQNFRTFADLEINPLSRINLLIGKNNAGKTSLLEALFLLSAAGNPQIALNQNVTRIAENLAPGVLSDTFWKAMFNGFDSRKEVSISANHTTFGHQTLKFSLKRPVTFNLPVEDTARLSMPELSSTFGIKFSFNDDKPSPVEGQIRATGHGFNVEQPTSPPPFSAILLTSRGGSHREDAQRLGQLRRQKQGDLLTEALRIVEPRLTSVEDNTAAGIPMIWGDVGLAELVPLQVMGDGMTRIARLVLAISAARDGMVLVDEFENGIHHSVLERVWKTVSTAADKFNAQIFASTHSFECLEAAHNALGGDSLGVHRLESIGGTIRSVSYDPTDLEAAVSYGLEVR